MDPDVASRIREAVRSGDEDRWNRAMGWVAENEPRPSMPTRYERQVRDESPKGEPDWSLWRCPACGTEQTGEVCGYCEREANVNENRRSAGGRKPHQSG